MYNFFLQHNYFSLFFISLLSVTPSVIWSAEQVGPLNQEEYKKRVSAFFDANKTLGLGNDLFKCFINKQDDSAAKEFFYKVIHPGLMKMQYALGDLQNQSDYQEAKAGDRSVLFRLILDAGLVNDANKKKDADEREASLAEGQFALIGSFVTILHTVRSDLEIWSDKIKNAQKFYWPSAEKKSLLRDVDAALSVIIDVEANHFMPSYYDTLKKLEDFSDKKNPVILDRVLRQAVPIYFLGTIMGYKSMFDKVYQTSADDKLGYDDFSPKFERIRNLYLTFFKKNSRAFHETGAAQIIASGLVRSCHFSNQFNLQMYNIADQNVKEHNPSLFKRSERILLNQKWPLIEAQEEDRKYRMYGFWSCIDFELDIKKQFVSFMNQYYVYDFQRVSSLKLFERTSVLSIAHLLKYSSNVSKNSSNLEPLVSGKSIEYQVLHQNHVHELYKEVHNHIKKKGVWAIDQNLNAAINRYADIMFNIDHSVYMQNGQKALAPSIPNTYGSQHQRECDFLIAYANIHRLNVLMNCRIGKAFNFSKVEKNFNYYPISYLLMSDHANANLASFDLTILRNMLDELEKKSCAV